MKKSEKEVKKVIKQLKEELLPILRKIFPSTGPLTEDSDLITLNPLSTELNNHIFILKLKVGEIEQELIVKLTNKGAKKTKDPGTNYFKLTREFIKSV